ncbi:uncharacterized protein LOC120415942 [Culex pipiens pallens]|uniref:uncharacterized protein LOC120415942 n=1 Tax=Culex pipiens pallens TaxID=42434 RepID=UPI001953FAFB|nr:uncharacterized protein LOC120415942 [Culex pipiens pallens]
MEGGNARVLEKLKISDHETVGITIGTSSIHLAERNKTRPGGQPATEIVFGKPRGDAETARLLNNFFVRSVEEIHEGIPPTTFTPVSGEAELDELMSEFEPITLSKLKETVRSLKDCAGVRNVTKRVMMDALDVVAVDLLDIVNKSLTRGEFPAAWKKTLVVPISKVPRSKKPEDHRPINMLPLYEKVMETIVKEQLMSFIDRTGVLLKEQSGFRRHHSCESALNLLLLKWKQCIEEGSIVLSVFVDLKRAFETIDRKKLIGVLQKSGIRGTVLRWFISYLDNRKQVTKYNSAVSPETSVNLGVPQGSVLGPLLFILYINDIKQALRRTQVNLFADDTVLFVVGDSFDECFDVMNEELVGFSEWLKWKKLQLNIAKTKCMVVTTRQTNECRRRVQMDGGSVERHFRLAAIVLLSAAVLAAKEPQKPKPTKATPVTASPKAPAKTPHGKREAPVGYGHMDYIPPSHPGYSYGIAQPSFNLPQYSGHKYFGMPSYKFAAAPQSSYFAPVSQHGFNSLADSSVKYSIGSKELAELIKALHSPSPAISIKAVPTGHGWDTPYNYDAFAHYKPTMYKVHEISPSYGAPLATPYLPPSYGIPQQPSEPTYPTGVKGVRHYASSVNAPVPDIYSGNKYISAIKPINVHTPAQVVSPLHTSIHAQKPFKPSTYLGSSNDISDYTQTQTPTSSSAHNAYLAPTLQYLPPAKPQNKITFDQPSKSYLPPVPVKTNNGYLPPPKPANTYLPVASPNHNYIPVTSNDDNVKHYQHLQPPHSSEESNESAYDYHASAPSGSTAKPHHHPWQP